MNTNLGKALGRDIFTQESFNSCRDLKVQHREPCVFDKQMAENGELPVFGRLDLHDLIS